MVDERNDSMHAFSWSSQRTLTLFMVLLLLATGGLVPLRADPAAAQPLCLDDTIWDAEEEACVELASPTPTEDGTEPTSTETPEPTIADQEESADDDEQEESADDDEQETATDAGDAGTEPTAASTPDNEALVRSGDNPMFLGIFSMGCPWNFDIAHADQDTRMTTCHTWVGNVTYDLTIDGYHYGTETSPGSVGGVSINIVPGQAELTITPPSNYQKPLAVACTTGLNVEQSRNATHTDSTGMSGLSRIPLEFHADEYWYCSAYFHPVPTGSITLDVRQCPDGLDIYNTGPEVLKDTCTGSASGIEFMLLHNSAGVSLASTSNTSKALFYQVPPGTGRVQMAPPAGVGLPMVYCETVGPQGQTFRQYDWVYVSIDASFEVSFANDETTFCDVYIVNGGIDVESETSDPEWVEGLPPASPEVEDGT
jgi:hypothetical protein